MNSRGWARFDKMRSLPMLALLTRIELRDGPMVAHDTRPYLAALTLVVLQKMLRTFVRHDGSFPIGLINNSVHGLATPGDDFLVALGAEGMLAGKIAVFRTDRESRRDRNVGQAETRKCRTH